MGNLVMPADVTVLHNQAGQVIVGQAKRPLVLMEIIQGDVKGIASVWPA
jgi:hypothetical protein